MIIKLQTCNQTTKQEHDSKTHNRSNNEQTRDFLPFWSWDQGPVEFGEKSILTIKIGKIWCNLKELVLFDLILYVPSTIFQLNRDGSSWVEPVLSWDKCVLLKDHNTVKPVRLEPTAARSRVKHSATEPLRSLWKNWTAILNGLKP